MKIKNLVFFLFGTLAILLAFFLLSKKDVAAKESYQIETIPLPKDVLLEVGGLAFTDKDQLGISTRRGEVWILENPYLTGDEKPVFRKYASGLHEPLGLAWYRHNFVLSQRGELTQLQDTDGDGIADRYKAIYYWPLSGNYHEYSYGAVLDLDSNMLVTLNSTWVGDHMESLAKWRGWLLKITPEGEMTPWATGLRSPAGLGINMEGDIFYTENQGDWVGAGRITHLEKGDFAGNPAGLTWTGEENSPLSLKQKNIPNTGLPLHEIASDIPELKLPAVWLPHGIIGTSTSDILLDTTNGSFGPFSGQMFVGDQGQSKITRVFMEKVEGEYQGACFPFMEGFSSGVFRMKWGSDHSMFIGMTSRGWNSTGPEMFGLQRLRWTGKTPFEIKAIKAQADGFLLEFTQPVDKNLASKPESYTVSGFTYHYWSRYGSKILNQRDCMVHQAEVAPDGMSVRLMVHGLRKGYIHEVKAPGVKSEKRLTLLHNVGYYTLNNVPGGKLSGTQDTSSSKTDNTNLENSEKHRTTLPPSWTAGADQTITIGTKPGLQFDITELKIKAKSKIKLVFENNDDMLHNFVITQPGDFADKVGRMAMEMGLKGPELQYIPLSESVLFHTSLLQPQSRETIYFEAPAAGIYPYLCTYPGHYLIMRGRMIVE